MKQEKKSDKDSSELLYSSNWSDRWYPNYKQYLFYCFILFSVGLYSILFILFEYFETGIMGPIYISIIIFFIGTLCIILSIYFIYVLIRRMPFKIYSYGLTISIVKFRDGFYRNEQILLFEDIKLIQIIKRKNIENKKIIIKYIGNNKIKSFTLNELSDRIDGDRIISILNNIIPNKIHIS